MKCKRAYKERLYPTPEQENLLAQSFGCARFVYNNTLRFRTDAYYKDSTSISHSQAEKRLISLKKAFPFLKDISSVILQQSVENLAVKNMIQNPKLAKHIADANWGEFVQQLQCKAECSGREIAVIDRFFPSFKRCSASGCGFVNESLPLTIREWACPKCKTNHDRDINAAKNIKTVGLAGLACEATGAGIAA